MYKNTVIKAFRMLLLRATSYAPGTSNAQTVCRFSPRVINVTEIRPREIASATLWSTCLLLTPTLNLLLSDDRRWWPSPWSFPSGRFQLTPIRFSFVIAYFCSPISHFMTLSPQSLGESAVLTEPPASFRSRAHALCSSESRVPRCPASSDNNRGQFLLFDNSSVSQSCWYLPYFQWVLIDFCIDTLALAIILHSIKPLYTFGVCSSSITTLTALSSG